MALKSKKLILLIGVTVLLLSGCGKTQTTVVEDTERNLSEETTESGEAAVENIFGENVYVFTPQDDPTEVNDELHRIFVKQETAQFDERRYAIMFTPGEYSEDIKLSLIHI